MLGIGAKGRLERDRVVSIWEKRGNRKLDGKRPLDRGRWDGSSLTLCSRRAVKGQRVIVTITLITEEKGESLAICREVEKNKVTPMTQRKGKSTE